MTLEVIDKMILTAGPSISDREVEYGVDAIRNGWNNHHSDYIKKFERSFGDYVGAKNALATSSCTGAMHVALVALGYGPGDEIIVPEITWIATAAVVKYVGATPIFCDVDKDSWTMCPKSVEKLITPRTKAIMPVHIYGHPCEMEPLWDLAKKHNLRIIEDAAQSIGAEYKGKRTGALGDVGAFSFQGAKAIVTGEGGIYTSNDDELTEKFEFYWNQGRDPNKSLYNTDIGYKYKMSNVQASIGLAQIERVDEIVARKIQIFKWYQERLGDLSDLMTLNTEKSWAKNIYWMSSVVLKEKAGISREDFMAKLKERMVDSRPIFYPLSCFPMFKKVDNGNAYDVGFNGVNLPSGHNRTEEEIDYICGHIKDVLGVKDSGAGVSGWLKYRQDVESYLDECKKFGKEIPIAECEGSLACLTFDDLNDNSKIELLAKWRRENQESFPSQSEITLEGTKKWLEDAVLKRDDRILFFVINKDGDLVGHIGLYRFNYHKRFCELDNVIRGVKGVSKGIMNMACRTLIEVSKSDLGLQDMYLRVMSDNDAALKLYSDIGFEEILRVPLVDKIQGDSVVSKEIISDPYAAVSKYFVTMKLQ